MSIAASGQLCHTLMPSGNGGEGSDVVGLGGDRVRWSLTSTPDS